MKRILFIATGGTIASSPTEIGLAPALGAEALIESVPQIEGLCEVETVSPMSLDSTNMSPTHWLQMAACVEKEYDRFDGFVIAHGTDTMAYTAGALTYLCQHSPKPIVLTGAQKPISLRETDARTNLADAFAYAVDGEARGVVIVFDGKVITGSRARKLRTKSWNAFASVDYPELGVILDGKILRYISEPETAERPTFYRELDPRVALIKLVPGMEADVLDFLRARNHALVIESFGVGGLPHAEGELFLEAVRRWQTEGKPVVITTQVPHEGSDMSLYQVGARVKSRFDVIEAYNMTLESVMTKLMWILGQTKDSARVRQLFYTPVAHDLLVVG